MKIKINVTQKDIDEGVRYNCLKCPIARAMRRHKQLKDSVVTGGCYKLIGHAYEFHALPLRVQNFVFLFDAQKPVKPFTFRVEVPDEVTY